MSSNRNPVKQWTVTFPQSEDVERKDFAQSFPPAVAVICAREEHADGGFHLHLGLKLKKGLSFSGMRKWVEAKWPQDYLRIKFEGAKNMSNWIDYCSKEDPNVYTHGSFEGGKRQLNSMPDYAPHQNWDRLRGHEEWLKAIAIPVPPHDDDAYFKWLEDKMS